MSRPWGTGERQRWCARIGVWSIGILAPISIVVHAVHAQGAYNVMPAARASAGMAVESPSMKSAQTVTVTLTVSDSSIGYVVREMVHQAHLRVSYNSADSLFLKRVNVHVVKTPIMDALAVALKGTGLAAKMAADGETVVIRAAADSMPAQRSHADAGSVSGTVVDSATGTPVIGAKVAVHGMTIAAVSSETGMFTLADVPAGDQLVEIRAFGYKPVNRTVTVLDNERRTVSIVMTPLGTILSGVVTTATGIQSKMSVGSDITTINVDSVMKIAPINSVTDLLENRVPGLTVVHTDGTPGDPSRLLLRGAASMYESNNPIVVVDGVRVYDPADLGSVQQQMGVQNAPDQSISSSLARPSPLDQIDPNAIETIEVMKGPSASALYGSDAANGVIVITTKKGRSGQTHWSVSASQGVEYIPGSYPELTYSYGRYIGQTGSDSPTCINGFIDQFVGEAEALVPCYVDSVHTDQALNEPRWSPLTHGALSTASATVSGGGQALTYSFTGSGSNTQGMTKLPDGEAQLYTQVAGASPPSWMRRPDDYQTWNGDGTMTATLSPTSTFTFSNLLSSSTQHRTDLGLNAVGDLIDQDINASTLSVSTLTNVFTKITQATLVSTTNATLNWQVRPWLPLAVTAGLNRSDETDKQYMPSGLPASILAVVTDTTGYYDLANDHATVATLNASTTIPVSSWRGRTLRLSVGTNFVNQSTAQQDISTTSVPVGVSDPTSFLQTATGVTQITQSSATYGWFMEPQLDFHSRFFVMPGFRFDGGTSTGTHAGLSAFPKINLSYVALDHSTETGRSAWARTFTLLRLRGAFGIAGVQPTPDMNLRLFSEPITTSLNGGTTSVTESLLHALGNTTLTPERSREIETGFDAQLWQNRISLTATYYNKLRIDAIQSVPVAPSVLGTASEFVNIGNVLNKGLELTATARLLDQGPVTWDINSSLSNNSNRVTKSMVSNNLWCNQGDSPTGGVGLVCIRQGYPLGAVFVPTLAGVYDSNGNGVIDPNEMQFSDSSQYLGSTDPRYTASFGSTMALWHGRVSISASGDYQAGQVQYNTMIPQLIVHAANGSNLSGAGQIITNLAQGGNNNALYSQIVNTLRWDDLSMNIMLPSKIAKALKGQQATLAIQGSNLLLLTNYHDVDPDVNAVVSGLGTGDSGQLPEPRTWRLSMRVTQ